MTQEMQKVLSGNPRNEQTSHEQPTNEGPMTEEVRQEEQPRVEEESDKGKISKELGMDLKIVTPPHNNFQLRELTWENFLQLFRKR